MNPKTVLHSYLYVDDIGVLLDVGLDDLVHVVELDPQGLLLDPLLNADGVHVAEQKHVLKLDLDAGSLHEKRALYDLLAEKTTYQVYLYFT